MTSLTIAITGASGFIGQALSLFLKQQGHRIISIVRTPAHSHQIFWDPSRAYIEKEKLNSIDGVIHLAGASIASGRWTEKQKRLLITSRVQSTHLLVHALNATSRGPQWLISASAIGFYGSHAQADESSAPGNDFLAHLCEEWERAAKNFTKGRLIIPRIGMVLSPEGGVLKRLLPVFRLGLGARIGSGRQWMSWISLKDLLSIFARFIVDTQLSGPINLVTPRPISHTHFIKALAHAVHRPALLAVPSWAVPIIWGEMGQSTLLSSSYILPSRLLEAKVSFHHPNIEEALHQMLT